MSISSQSNKLVVQNLVKHFLNITFSPKLQVLLITLIAASVMIAEAKPVDETIGGSGGALKPQEPSEILKLLLLKKLLLLG